MRVNFGRAGEKIAADAIERLGWKIIDRNWRCALGEIDLVAIDSSTSPNPTTVIIEVKTRSGKDFGDPLEAVTVDKLKRLRRLAVQWQKEHPDSPRLLRIDVVGVVKRRGYAPFIDHRQGVS